VTHNTARTKFSTTSSFVVQSAGLRNNNQSHPRCEIPRRLPWISQDGGSSLRSSSEAEEKEAEKWGWIEEKV